MDRDICGGTAGQRQQFLAIPTTPHYGGVAETWLVLHSTAARLLLSEIKADL